MKSPTAKDQSVREGDFCGGFILLGFYRGATLGAICSLVNRDNARLLAIHQFKRLPNLSMANSCSRRNRSLIEPAAVLTDHSSGLVIEVSFQIAYESGKAPRDSDDVVAWRIVLDAAGKPAAARVTLVPRESRRQNLACTRICRRTPPANSTWMASRRAITNSLRGKRCQTARG